MGFRSSTVLGVGLGFQSPPEINCWVTQTPNRLLEQIHLPLCRTPLNGELGDRELVSAENPNYGVDAAPVQESSRTGAALV